MREFDDFIDDTCSADLEAEAAMQQEQEDDDREAEELSPLRYRNPNMCYRVPEDYEDDVVQEDLSHHAAGTLQSMTRLSPTKQRMTQLSDEDEPLSQEPRAEGKCLMVVGVDENGGDIICGNPCNASEQDCHWCRQQVMHMMWRS